MIVMGTSSLTGANVIDAEGNLPSSQLLLNMIDYLNGREGIAEMRSKGARVPRLPETSSFTRGFAKYFNIAGLPVIVILAGVAIWLVNRTRRRRIQLRFSGVSGE